MFFSDRELSKRIERTEGLANADFVESRARLTAGSPATWIQVAGAYALFDGKDSPCTQTFGLGMSDEVTAEDMDTIEAFFKEREAPIYHEVSPHADPKLLKLLLKRNYHPFEYTSVMFRQMGQQQHNSNISVRLIEDNETELWAETSARGWTAEMPELFDYMVSFAKISAHCTNNYPFIAEINNKPIATAALFIFERAAVFAGDSTVLEGRNQGAQKALVEARLKFASDKGCDIAIMCASPGSQSQKNAEKNGFRIAYTRTKWQKASKNLLLG